MGPFSILEVSLNRLMGRGQLDCADILINHGSREWYKAILTALPESGTIPAQRHTEFITSIPLKSLHGKVAQRNMGHGLTHCS